MTESAIRARRDAIRAEYLDEEAEAGDVEALESDQAVLSVRVSRCSRRGAEGTCGRGARPDVGVDPTDSGARRTGGPGTITTADRGACGGDSAADRARVGLTMIEHVPSCMSCRALLVGCARRRRWRGVVGRRRC